MELQKTSVVIWWPHFLMGMVGASHVLQDVWPALALNHPSICAFYVIPSTGMLLPACYAVILGTDSILMDRILVLIATPFTLFALNVSWMEKVWNVYLAQAVGMQKTMFVKTVWKIVWLAQMEIHVNSVKTVLKKKEADANAL